MNLDNLISTRRSIRKFTDKKVEKNYIEQVIDAARWAPSASNLQLWNFMVIQKESNLNKIKLFSPGMSRTAPCVIAICVDLAEAEARGGLLIRKIAPLDAAFAAQNILLKAHELGLGTCVVKSYDQESIDKILKLPKDVSAILLICIGYYDNIPKTPIKKELSEVIHYDTREGEQESNE